MYNNTFCLISNFEYDVPAYIVLCFKIASTNQNKELFMNNDYFQNKANILACVQIYFLHICINDWFSIGELQTVQTE